MGASRERDLSRDASRDIRAANTFDATAHDGAGSKPTHIVVSRLTIGSWNLVAKSDEQLLLSFYWAERKLVWEVLHLGVVRKMEADFEDVMSTILHAVGTPEEAERFVVELARPPRFYREAPAASEDEARSSPRAANYVYTTDFTNGQASQVSRHVLHFPAGALSPHAGMLKRAGLSLRLEGALAAPAGGGVLGGGGEARRAGTLAMSVRLRQPPTSSPRLDAIILQEQLEREMRECQARYTGICPVRARLYAAALDELTTAIARDESKRGTLLRRVTAESRMTIDAYRTVYEKSLLFGMGKLDEAVSLKGDLQAQVNVLEGAIGTLKADVRRLTELFESLSYREEASAKSHGAERRDVADLKAESRQLSALLEVLRPSRLDKGRH